VLACPEPPVVPCPHTMRVILLIALVALFAGVAVRAAEEEAPVPEGFSLPNIFNPVADRADGREQAKVLVNLVAKEPKVAFGVGGPEAAVVDLWNGEKDPISSASVAQLKMLREVDSLTKLIAQGKKILKVLPRKQKRLALLKKKLSKILDAKAKKAAAEKLEQQQALLNAIKKREGKMSSRLSALKKSQKKLTASVGALQGVIAGKKGKKGKKAGKKSKKGKKAKKTVAPRFAEVDQEAEAETELDAETEMEAAEAYAEEIAQQ
jgi:hypothetical protein